jgi:hypothetical protein
MEAWGSRPNRTAVHIHGTKGRTPSRTLPVDDRYIRFHPYAMEWYPDDAGRIVARCDEST